MQERGPTQLNIPRDYFYGEHEFVIPPPMDVERSAGGPASLQSAAELLASAKNPMILAGGGVVIGDAQKEVIQLAEHMQCPVACTYLHNDAFPASHPLMCGPLGYQGSQAAMSAMREADVILAIGTRMNPFGTLPQYGMDYWPKAAKLIQVDVDHRRLGLTKEVAVPIHGDARLASAAILSHLEGMDVDCRSTVSERVARMKGFQAKWEATLDEMTNGAPHAPEGLIKPRQALRILPVQSKLQSSQ